MSGLFSFPGPGPVPGASSAAGLSDTVLRTTFVPTVTYSVPGDVAVAYTTQQGAYAKVGPLVLFWINLVFQPTFTTAAGTLNISLPPPPITDLMWGWPVRQISSTQWSGTTTDLTARPVAGAINLFAQGSNAIGTALGVASFSSGNTWSVIFSGFYF